MRLFTGLDIPGDVLANLTELLGKLRPTARLKWSPPENLHITTKFVGEWPEARLPELETALAVVTSRPPLTVKIRRVGFYPNPHSPRIFWCGIEAAGLPELAAATDDATASLGIAREAKKYSPHLTLARIKDPVPLQPLRETIAALPSLDFGEFTAAGFHLYLSKVGAAGSVYTKLREFPLQK